MREALTDTAADGGAATVLLLLRIVRRRSGREVRHGASRVLAGALGLRRVRRRLCAPPLAAGGGGEVAHHRRVARARRRYGAVDGGAVARRYLRVGGGRGGGEEVSICRCVLCNASDATRANPRPIHQTRCHRTYATAGAAAFSTTEQADLASLSGASSGENDWEEEEEEEAARRRSGAGGELRRCGGLRRSATEAGLHRPPSVVRSRGNRRKGARVPSERRRAGPRRRRRRGMGTTERPSTTPATMRWCGGAVMCQAWWLGRMGGLRAAVAVRSLV